MVAATIEEIADRLYAEIPRDILFHYTSLAALLSILRDQSIRAGDIRFLSDASELTHFMKALQSRIRTRIDEGGEVLQQFHDWLQHRMPQGHMIFAASFSIQGDLLSQWRAYSPPGKGVSLGFAPDSILRASNYQRSLNEQQLQDPRRRLNITGHSRTSVFSKAWRILSFGSARSLNIQPLVRS